MADHTDRTPAAAAWLTARAAAAAAYAAQVRDRAVARLAASPAGRQPATDPGRLHAANLEAAAFYRDQLQAPAGASPRAYLVGRGGDAVLAAGSRWAVGYAPPGWTRLVQHLHRLGFHDDDLLASGLATQGPTGTLIDVFRDRLTFGVHDLSGNLAGFIARAAPHAPRGPRYLNTAETPLFAKGRLLFGLWEQLPLITNPTRPLILVEGAFDVIAIVAAGQTRPNIALVALAPSGTALTRAHVDLLDPATGPDRPTILAFDADPAGQRAADRAFTLLDGDLPADVANTRRRRPLYSLDLPAGTDPADMLQRHGPADLQRLLTDPAHRSPLIDTVLDYRTSPWHDWPGPRIRAAEIIAPVIAAQPPAEITRLVIRTAARLNLHPSTITTLVTDAITASFHADDQPPRRQPPETTNRDTCPTSRATPTAISLHKATYPGVVRAAGRQQPISPARSPQPHPARQPAAHPGSATHGLR